MSGSRWLYQLALGGFLGAVLLAAPALAQDVVGQDDNQERREQTQPDRTEEGAVESPNAPTAVTRDIPQSSEVKDQDQASSGGGTEQSFNERIAALWTTDTPAQWVMAVTGVVATLVSIIAVGLLYCTFKATRAAVREAERATAAARDTIRVTEKANERELRAYMSLTPHGAHHAGVEFIIRVKQRNNGQTPASNVRFAWHLDYHPHPLPDDFEWPEPNFGESRNVVAPHHEFSVTLKAPGRIDDQAVVELKVIDRRLYFIGHVAYTDAFEKERMTRVCWSYPNEDILRVIENLERLRARGHESGVQPTDIGFDYTRMHNDAT